jgi:hypothetical protein
LRGQQLTGKNETPPCGGVSLITLRRGALPVLLTLLGTTTLLLLAGFLLSATLLTTLLLTTLLLLAGLLVRVLILVHLHSPTWLEAL